MSVKRMPIRAAKRIADEFGQDQVVIVTFEKGTGTTHVVTYGKTQEECEQAAQGGNFVKKALGWPESLCNTKPARARRCRECRKVATNVVHDSESMHFKHLFDGGDHGTK